MGFDRQLRYVFIYPEVTAVSEIPLTDYISKPNEELEMLLGLCDSWKRHLREVFETGQPNEMSTS